MAVLRMLVTSSVLLVWCLLCGTVDAESKDDQPPQILSHMSQSIVYVDSSFRQNYNIQCKASGYPSPTFQWKKNGVLLDDTRETVQAFTNGTLHFKYFTDNDNGLYQCLATNKFGTSVSVKIPILNTKPPLKNNSNQHEPDQKNIEEGKPVAFTCTKTPVTIPKWNKKWYYVVESLEVLDTERVGTDSEGTLRFAYVVKDDEKSYICGVVPSALTPKEYHTMYETMKLSVTKSDTGVAGKQISPSLGFKSNDIKANIGETVTLECFFNGRPVPTITWTSSRNKPIETGNTRLEVSPTHFGRKLIIRNLTEDDEGDFSCKADNGFGNTVRSIRVNVTSPPIKIPNQGLITVVKPARNDTVIVLQCKAGSAFNENLDTPVWYRNNVLLHLGTVPDQERYFFNKGYTELHIKNPDKIKDTACFQCNVSNSEGYAFYDGYLKVIDSIKITKHPNPVNRISRYDDIDISVHSVGDVCCSNVKTWYLNDVRLTVDQLNELPFVYNADMDTLRFQTRDVTNETLAERLGKYKCNVSNLYDFQVIEFTISLLDITTDPESLRAGAVFEMWWLAIILGILFIIIAAIIFFIIMKTNYPRETYELEKTELKHHLNPKEDLLNQSFINI